jgi:hypothetical protein
MTTERACYRGHVLPTAHNIGAHGSRCEQLRTARRQKKASDGAVRRTMWVTQNAEYADVAATT